MTSPTTNRPVLKTPYLENQRNMPTRSIEELATELNKVYIDIAQRVNEREIAVYPLDFYVATGQKWYLTVNQAPRLREPNQSLRRVFRFSSTGNIAHGLNFDDILAITSISGTFTDSTNWYPLPYVDVSNIINQIMIRVSPSDIEITSGAGAPTITDGFIVLEWLAKT